MKYAKLFGAVLVAAFAMSAITAATAAATPEFLTAGGAAAIGLTLTGVSTAGSLVGGGNTISCTGGGNTGTINGNSTVDKVTVTYSGCLNNANKKGCLSTNTSVLGLIVTNTLEGRLGTLANGLSGLLLLPEGATNFTTISATKCISQQISVTGSVIGEIPQAPGTALLTGELNFAATGSSQTPQGFGTTKGELLDAFNNVASGLNVGNTITFSEPVNVS